jgi:hypothetical protein
MASIAVPTSAIAEPLHLVCLGEGSANRPAVTTGYVQDNHGNSGWGQVVGRRSVPFDDQVNVDLADDGTGRIRMPRAMLPRIHGGSDGWFQIKDVERTDTEITGKVQVNFMNSPRLRLDRLTGRISLNGRSGDYAGECQPYDPGTAERKF